jgi:hypothetical protein
MFGKGCGMARGLQFHLHIMQIPYDLEFVESRPTVHVRVATLPERRRVWRGKARSEEDVFDSLLRWVHRQIARLDSRSQ